MKARSSASVIVTVLLCTCGPAPSAPDAQLTESRQYAWLSGRPPSATSYPDRYPGYRLELEGDTARIYNLFGTFEAVYPAYAESEATGTGDTTYLTYGSPGPDADLDISVYEGGSVVTSQRYRPAEAIVVPEEPARYWGKAYALAVDSVDYVVYLEPVLNSGLLMGNVLRLAPGRQRRAVARAMAHQFATNKIILWLPDGADRGDARRRRTRMVVTEAADGSPQLHRLNASGAVVGPYPLEPYMSAIPDSVPPAELLRILNTGTIAMGDIPPEPDSLGIEYVTTEASLPPWLLSYAELPQLDFSFQEDGSFSVFVADRVVSEGKWNFSEGRQFINIYGRSSMSGTAARLIASYTERCLSFSVPLRVRTKEARGVRLPSYFTAEVPLTFCAE